MNRPHQFLILLSLILIISITCVAQDSTAQKTRVTPDMIEDNLLVGAESDNEGLRISSTYYLGETESQDAVIPHMKILHNDKSVHARIMAALSLFKIVDSRDIFAGKNSAKSDSSVTVRKMCGILYNMHSEKKNCLFHQYMFPSWQFGRLWVWRRGLILGLGWVGLV